MGKRSTWPRKATSYCTATACCGSATRASNWKKCRASSVGSSRWSSPEMRRRESGYALLVVILLAALVLIALSAVVPQVLTQGQREKEEELVFRGGQIGRAACRERV